MSTICLSLEITLPTSETVSTSWKSSACLSPRERILCSLPSEISTTMKTIQFYFVWFPDSSYIWNILSRLPHLILWRSCLSCTSTSGQASHGNTLQIVPISTSNQNSLYALHQICFWYLNMYIFYSLDQKDLDSHLIKNTSVSLSVMTLFKKNQTSRGKIHMH